MKHIIIKKGEKIKLERKAVSGIMLTPLLTSMLTLAFNIPRVKASGTVYIMADGSVDPPTAPISSADNIIYTFTDTINDSIVVERDNIVVDGADYSLQGTETEIGIYLFGRSNVTIKNMKIEGFGTGIRLEVSSNINVSGNDITSNLFGIYLSSPNNNVIRGNDITNSFAGIWLGSSSNNSLFGNNITNNTWGVVFFVFSNGNTLSGNNITANDEQGVQLYASSNNNVVGNNIANNNLYGVYLQSASGNKFYHNNFVDNALQVYIPSEGGANLWDGGYPSGGNYWSDYTEVDFYSGPYQNVTGSDGIGDTPYVLDADNQDNYPLTCPYVSPFPQTFNLTITTTVGGTTSPAPGIYTYTAGSTVPVTAIPNTGHVLDHWELDNTNVAATNPINVTMDNNHTMHAVFVASIHDVAITNVTPSKTVVGQGYSISIDATVANQCNYTENFSIIAYANTTIITTLENITVSSGDSVIISFAWDTTGFVKGNYTLSALADTVPGEIDTVDNTFVDDWVIVAMVGDITGDDGWPDGKVDILDIATVAILFGVVYPDPLYNPNYDIDGDQKIDILDIATVAIHFGEIDP